MVSFTDTITLAGAPAEAACSRTRGANPRGGLGPWAQGRRALSPPRPQGDGRFWRRTRPAGRGQTAGMPVFPPGPPGIQNHLGQRDRVDKRDHQVNGSPLSGPVGVVEILTGRKRAQPACVATEVLAYPSGERRERAPSGATPGLPRRSKRIASFPWRAGPKEAGASLSEHEHWAHACSSFRCFPQAPQLGHIAPDPGWPGTPSTSLW